jgi:hypothetical protein
MSYRYFAFVVLTLFLAPTASAQVQQIPFGSRANQLQRSNGTFFPIGIFSANPPAALPELKAAGFNTVQTYRITSINELNTYLQIAADNNLKTMVYPSMRIDEKAGSVRSAARALDHIWPQIRNQSALLAWYIADEPEHAGLSYDDLADFEREIKEKDPTHITALTTGPNHYQEFKDIGDVLIVDPYPVPISPVTEVSDTLERAKRVIGNKPIWAVIQAFDRGLFEKKVADMKSAGLRRNTAPAVDEINCMTFLAIVHGAKGIFFYSFKESKYDIREHAEIWEGVKHVVARLNAIYPIIVSSDTSLQAAIRSEQSGLSPTNIHHLVKSRDGELYLIAVNSNDRQETVTFSALPIERMSVAVVGEKRTIPLESGTVTDVFKPYEVHIYKL